ncbi:hypothetical protein F2Q69_00015698 [Brassica cretica]|uniref:Retrotransposon gag domain-containing protein n=1 Tax=Brassica cretica TaxID=69181 RepID=A0A8S9QPI8_BRACR|nr:hypothetical protein F2Q69_00015698 [Brassica cretica]
MLRDEKGRTRNSAGLLINAQGQDPFQGLPHQDPRNHIEELEDLVSRSEQNEVFEYHMLCKIFPYSISGDAFRWFLASLDEEYMISIQLLDDIMAKRDEKHVSGELSRVEEAGNGDAVSTSIDGTTSMSIDSMTSTSTDNKTSKSIDRSTQRITDVSSCVLVPDVDREITMEDFSELEDETQPENLDHNLEKKLDDHQHTSEKDLETSLEASIDLHPPYIIDQHTPYIIDHHPPKSIDRHPVLDEPHGFIVEMEPIKERVHKSETSRNDDYKHLRPLTCAEEADGLHKRVKRIHDPVKIVVPCAVVEVEFPIPPDKGEHLSSYVEVLDDHQHIDTTTSSLIDTGRVSEQKEFDVCGNLRDGEITTRSDKSGGKKRRNWKKRKRIMGDSQLSLITRFSDGVWKSRVHNICFSQPFANLRALLLAEMIDKGEESMEEAFTQE